MKYLITGITGFVGPNLAKMLLSDGHEVHGIIRCPNGRSIDILDTLTLDEYNQIVFHSVDLKHYYGVKKIIDGCEFDGIFHLAAQSHPPTSFKDPILTFNENVNGTVNIITSIQNTPTKLMFCSTSEVYGDTCKKKGILKVTDALSPSNPYGSSKAAMDLYMQERMNNGFVNGFVTRAFSHTGIRRGYNFSISSDAFQIAKMVLGKQEKILKIGNLKTERVVLDVRDVCSCYYQLMKEPKSNGGVFNVCGTEKRQMQYYTNKLIELAGFKLNEVEQRIHKPFYRPIDIQVQIGDISEVKEIIDWEPKIHIDETLKSLLDYWIKKLKEQ